MLVDSKIEEIKSKINENIFNIAKFIGTDANNIIPINQEEKLCKETFQSRYLQGEGLPCVINDAMANWKAIKWDFNQLKLRFKDLDIQVQPSLQRKEKKFTISFPRYIEYILGQISSSNLVSHIDHKFENSERLYALVFHPFKEHPDLYCEFEETPYFIDDYFSTIFGNKFQKILRHFRHHWLFIGPKGSLAEFHSDHHSVATYLAQITGKKLAILVPPIDSEKIYFNGITLNPFKVDEAIFSKFRDVKFYVTVLEPGKMLFIPKNWNHYVLGLSPSITLSKDIVNHHNFSDYFLSMFVKDLPYLASQIDHLPEALKSELGIKWKLQIEKRVYDHFKY